MSTPNEINRSLVRENVRCVTAVDGQAVPMNSRQNILVVDTDGLAEGESFLVVLPDVVTCREQLLYVRLTGRCAGSVLIADGNDAVVSLQLELETAGAGACLVSDGLGFHVLAADTVVPEANPPEGGP